jgi:DNA-binding NtrC family response regulator
MSHTICFTWLVGIQMKIHTVLFVDDEQGIRETMPLILRMHGYDTTAAATVAEALAQITTRQFDVLISDLNIGQPGDGLTVVSAMRPLQPDCRTFILTGFPALDSALKAIRAQVDDYLIKPAEISALIATIAEHCQEDTRIHEGRV